MTSSVEAAPTSDEVGAGPVPETAPPAVTTSARVAFLVGCVVLVAIAAVTGVAFLPSSALVPLAERQALAPVRQVLPQGWAFFSKNPRDPVVTVWVRRGEGWARADEGTGNTPSRLFGADRSTRTEQYEVGALTAASEEVGWTACDDTSAAACLPDEVGAAHRVRLVGEHPRFCGAVALVRQEPVPWAWADLTTAMPVEHRVLDVECVTTTREDP